ncbi:MAG: transketolase C-terminal domain-containing protein, partial [Chloroflexota bacterium]
APTVLAFTRQNVPTLDRKIYAPASGLHKGAYVLADIGDGDPQIILMASGSELGLIVDAGIKLASEGINVRLVSMPCMEFFEMQLPAYRDSVLPPAITARLAVEAGVAQSWQKWIGSQGDCVCMTGYGASAPANVLFQKFGFTVENVMTKAKAVLATATTDDGRRTNAVAATMRKKEKKRKTKNKK